MVRGGQDIRDKNSPYLVPIALLFAMLAAAVSGAACSGGGHQSAGSPGATAAFAPTIEPAPEPIVQLMDRVAAVRELKPPASLKVGLVSRSDVPKLIDRLLSPEDRATMAKTTTLYRLLGLLGPDQSYLDVYRAYVAQALAGVYSPKDKALWVVHPDGQATDFAHLSTDEQQVLEHELTHAIQDANFNLDSISNSANGLDQSLAATALVEGDAVTTQRNYDARYKAMAVGGAVVLVDMARLAAGAPAAIQRELTFPYTQGADWVDGIRQRGGDSAVDALFRHVPEGTVFVFHPERIGTGWTPEVVTLPPIAASLGSGWTEQSSGQFGQFEVQNYLQIALPGLQAVQGADGWAGDHYAVYSHDGESVAVFRFMYDTPAHAQRFASTQRDLLKAQGAGMSVEGRRSTGTLSSGNTTVQLGTQGSTVTFVIGSAAGLAQRAAAALAHG